MFHFLLYLVAILVSVTGIIHLKRGAVFLPTHRKAVEKMITLLEIKAGERAVDLGSGDGRIVIALARAGAVSHGFEHNPLLVWWSRWRIREAGLSGKAFIHHENFWKADFSQFTVFTLFGINYIMKPLEDKIFSEAPSGARVVSYTFSFPTHTPISSEDGILLYKKEV